MRSAEGTTEICYSVVIQVDSKMISIMTSLLLKFMFVLRSAILQTAIHPSNDAKLRVVVEPMLLSFPQPIPASLSFSPYFSFSFCCFPVLCLCLVFSCFFALLIFVCNVSYVVSTMRALGMRR